MPPRPKADTGVFGGSWVYHAERFVLEFRPHCFWCYEVPLGECLTAAPRQEWTARTAGKGLVTEEDAADLVQALTDLRDPGETSRRGNLEMVSTHYRGGSRLIMGQRTVE